ncbi:hypothetical protein [Kitasatospora sp. NPDC015120]|uniref:hypothetical protein n=1 Tax=Kitasatospora sp. NPDC015120 TaxID=3364023 RepID=UPI0036F4943A
MGRDVLPDMWTYQVVEAYDDTDYRVLKQAEEQVRRELAAGHWNARLRGSAPSA